MGPNKKHSKKMTELYKNGLTPWNKGTKGIMKGNKTSFKKGEYQGFGFDKYLPIGIKNCNWKGGITPELKALRNSSQYRIWREYVFTRDDFTCQKCGLVGGQLNAHHIKHFSKYPKLRFDINNGVTLCIECHAEEHPELKCLSRV